MNVNNCMETKIETSECVSVKAEAWRGLNSALPVMLGFVPFALVLGVQATQKGLSYVEVPLMTGMNFGGGSEFAALKLWTSPPRVLLIVAMTVLINCRHILMGAAFAPHLKHLMKRQAIPALFFMCDESWAIALSDARQRSSGNVSFSYYLGVSVSLYLTWVIFTAVGAILGPVIGHVEHYGFDMAFVAVFLVLLKGMWRGFRACRPWLVSLVVAALTFHCVPGAWYVAAGAISGLIAAVFVGLEND